MLILDTVDEDGRSEYYLMRFWALTFLAPLEVADVGGVEFIRDESRVEIFCFSFVINNDSINSSNIILVIFLHVYDLGS